MIPFDKPTEPGGVVERLAAAEVGSRELDEAIHDLLCDRKFRTCIKGLSDADGGLWMYEFEGHSPSSALRVTTSLDAALAFAQRVLPRWGCDVGYPARLGEHGGRAWASVWPPVEDGEFARRSEYWGRENASSSAVPALALCLAILRAHPSDGESK